MARTFVDRGGSFTDVVVADAAVRLRKLPSDRAIAGELAEGPLTLGTTLATNALLEGRGVPTLLLVNEGFEDLLLLGDMSRRALFDPDAAWPVPAARVVGVRGRIDHRGVEIEPLRLPELDLAGIEAVAIALLFSPLNPAHERALAAALPPGLFCALGHRASPELGYLARVETTWLDAAITPVLQAGLRRDRLPPGTRAVRSDGSLCPAEALRAPEAVLSGPASGVAAVAAVVAQAGFGRGIGLDMGGTSTDICLVGPGPVPTTQEARINGIRVRRQQLAIETVAAGGGSVLRREGPLLRVGPDSAGADPGPQCRGRGGPPTLTDAALALGLVDPSAFDPPLDPGAVALPAPAADFVALAREHMAAAVRRIAAAQGADVAEHVLVAYGGAAGQHAAGVAERLGIRTVLFHPAAALLCAWGQAALRREERRLRPIWGLLPEAWPRVEAAWAECITEISLEGEVYRTVELRFKGTDHALEVEDEAAFRAEHRRRYGFDRSEAVEVVNARVCVREPAPPPLPPLPLPALELHGPTVLHLPTTSIELPAGWRLRTEAGLYRLDQVGAGPPPPTSPSVWGRRFARVAEEAGETLRRLARSVNIRERLDYSCAVFDEAGLLVASAPHVPVHLGAMGEMVRALSASGPMPDDQAWLGNDPATGGSHLPDLTLISPVRHGSRRFFVACRAHHVDVGGLTPGSMPPGSTRLADEGLVFRLVPVLDAGRLRPLALPGCREPDSVRADLAAQLAANAVAARALRELGPPEQLAEAMAALLDAAAAGIAPVLAGLRGQAADELDGIPLRLRVEGGCFDFGGSGGPHPGNKNAPRCVVRAAVLYALRVLAGDELPLSEGLLRDVELRLPPGILDPPPEAAVVGGNVETSQRVVDLVFAAVGARAASQGTMNNLSLGGRDWAYYETIGGGGGASPTAPGASGHQLHMTNTRATDPEILESRLPLRLRRFALRRGSGGAGRQPGGEGVIRELELLAPATAALLASRRDRGAPGLAGGGEGAPGVDRILRGGVEIPWSGEAVDLDAGDRLRIATPGGGGFGLPSAGKSR